MVALGFHELSSVQPGTSPIVLSERTRKLLTEGLFSGSPADLFESVEDSKTKKAVFVHSDEELIARYGRLSP